MMAEKLPLVMIDRPKMPRATWDALRNHIVNARRKKKMELEQNAEFERQKKVERELKKKQEAMTLEETKEQITQLETKLSNFKQEKHELFHKLKIVLYQDETRRKREDEAAHHNANLYLQPNARNVPGMSMRMGHTQLLIQQAPAQQQSQHGHKRPRSPSPQRSGIPPAYYRNQLHPGPSTTKASYSVPTSAHASHYTSYPGSAVVSVGNHLSQQEEAAARAAASKHIYLSAAGQGRNVYSDRDRAAAAALHQRSLAPPPAAHSAVSAAAAAAVYSRPGLASISGFQRYTNLPSAVTTANSAMLASSISSSPRTNGTGPPPTGSRYYRD